jgi:hypothetical protein
MKNVTIGLVPRFSFGYWNECGLISIDIGCFCVEIEINDPTTLETLQYETTPPTKDKTMKATSLHYAHENDATLNCLVFDNETLVYFAEDDTAVVQNPAGEQMEYVDGENPEIDKYIGEGSDPTLLYGLESVEMTAKETNFARKVLGS